MSTVTPARTAEILRTTRDLVSRGWTPVLAMRLGPAGPIYCTPTDERATLFSLEAAVERSSSSADEHMSVLQDIAEAANEMGDIGTLVLSAENEDSLPHILTCLHRALVRAERKSRNKGAA